MSLLGDREGGLALPQSLDLERVAGVGLQALGLAQQQLLFEQSLPDGRHLLARGPPGLVHLLGVLGGALVQFDGLLRGRQVGRRGLGAALGAGQFARGDLDRFAEELQVFFGTAQLGIPFANPGQQFRRRQHHQRIEAFDPVADLHERARDLGVEARFHQQGLPCRDFADPLDAVLRGEGRGDGEEQQGGGRSHGRGGYRDRTSAEA